MLLALLMMACSTEPGPPSAPEGAWLAGDLHVHSSVGSNDTDGLGLPGALGPAMEAAGLDFVYLTDHSNSMGSMACETGDVEDCPNQGPELPVADWPEGVFPASEISPIEVLGEFTNVPTGHVLCLPTGATSFPGLEAFEDRPPGTVTGAEAVAQCQDHGGYAIIAHPHAITPWIEFDWTTEGFDALEVYNGSTRFDGADWETIEEEWEPRVARGRDIPPVGSSDCHRWGTATPGDLLNPALGYPTTHVFVMGSEAPLDALRAGRIVIAEPGTELALQASTEAAIVIPGQRLAGPADLVASATTATTGLLLQLKVADGEVLDEVELEPGVAAEVRAVASAGQAVYARVWPSRVTQGMQGGVALTNVIRVE